MPRAKPDVQPRLKPAALVVTCEHGGNRVPSAYRHCFAEAGDTLASHRGWDPGALQLAKQTAARFGSPLHFSQVSRLLVELNRSTGHPSLFSPFTRPLPRDERLRILATVYRPYRSAVESEIRDAARSQRVFHLSVHSFTPVLGGEVRNADIGILYDPRRPWERDLAREWQGILARLAPELRVRRNYPYKGASDGLTKALRTMFPDPLYAGIELEVNQRFPLKGGGQWRELREAVLASIAVLLGRC